MTAVYHPGVITTIPKYDLGQPTNAANVINWQTAASGLTNAQLLVIQTAFDTAWYNLWKPWAANSIRYMGSWVVDNSSATGNQVTNALYTPQFATGSANAAGDALCALVSLHTATRYRGGHGRIYLPGVCTTGIQSDGHNLQGSTTSAITTGWAALVTAMGAIAGSAGGPLNPVVWHKRGGVLANTTENVIGIVAQPVMATQRRRQRKVTRHRRH